MLIIYMVAQHDGIVIRLHDNEENANAFCAALNAKLSDTAREHRPYTVDARIVWDKFEPLPCFGK